jgi:threonine dehydratase
MISLHDIETAAGRLQGRLVHTPFLPCRVLSQITGARLFVKFENHQFTASFKERGALNKLLELDAVAKSRGVALMSAGNHAQGVAFHAQQLGIPATVVMPRATPTVKVESTRAHGAEVILAGDSLADAAAEAARVTAERGLTFIHPYDDPAVMAGQGTVALEMLAAQPGLDALVVPIGGGGLIAGVATAVKALSPRTEVIGVQAALYPSMPRALAGESDAGGGNTIAEGIAVKYAGQLTREVVRARVDDILLVEEADIERAIALYLNVEKTVAEGAGAAALAAVLAHGDRFRGRTVGLILSGGNIDPRLLASVLMRELVREQRVVTIRFPVADQPGLLAKVTAAMSSAGANILEIQHFRTLLATPAKEADVQLTFEARDSGHALAVVDAVRQAGFAPAIVST